MIKKIFLLLSLFATVQAAMAQADPELDDAQLDSIFRHYELEEVVVTGTRTPKFLKDTPKRRILPYRHLHRLPDIQADRTIFLRAHRLQ